MAKKIIDIIDEIISITKNNSSDKGVQFERLMAIYLRTDPTYADRFSDVWLWSEWPDKWYAIDVGIDLIAREKVTGEYWAIQCKFYNPEHILQKHDIDSFFTASGKKFMTAEGEKNFSTRMIISTTYKWSKNAENAIADQLIPTVRIWFNDLEKSPIDWSSFDLYKMDDIRLKPKKITRMHQHEAIIAAINGYKKHDRGKIIMACGTGKTYTSLRLAEKITPQGGLILFLAPSISLVSQTLREWTAESLNPINAFVVCSDSKVGRNNDDIRLHDLAYPPTTNPQKLVKAIKTIILNNQRSRIVIFSTYQSIQSVADAQIYIGEFDLIICDEAHRTTGGTLCNEDSTHFLKIHDNNIIRGKKRLYMTATPRIYAEAAKIKANENDVELFSMDDTKTFGPEFYRLGFSKAVAMGLLSEYKVMIVCVDEARISALATAYKLNSNQAIDIRFAAKIMGCWKSLSKKDTLILSENGIFSNSVDSSFPMQRAVVFSKTIESSRNITATFNHIVEKYLSTNQGNDLIRCTLLHVDGTMNAQVRHQAIDWLRNQPEPNECRVLSNAKCLSEGVDVPALDAVIFF